MEITHPTNYERQISRALEAHLNRLAQVRFKFFYIIFDFSPKFRKD